MTAVDAGPVRGRSGEALRVGVLVEDRYLAQPEPRGVIEELRRSGHHVRVLVDVPAGFDLTEVGWVRDLDVLLARGRSAALLGLLRAAEASGVSVVNSAAAIESVVNKAGMGAMLAAAGLPVPATWVGSPRGLARLGGIRYPLVLKPICGDNARGLRVVGSAAELRALTWAEDAALAQEFHRGDGTDLKLYVAGDAVWAVRRPSPIEDCGRPRESPGGGVPVPVTPQLGALARRCGSVFGLRLFGVDCVDGPRGPLVVEVNDFPNYRGAPGADRALAGLVAGLAPARAGAAAS